MAGTGGGGLEGGVSMVESDVLQLSPFAVRFVSLLAGVGAIGVMTCPSSVMLSLRMTVRPVNAGFGSPVDGVFTGVGSGIGVFSRILLLRSKGERPRLFRISALFSQNSSMMSDFFEAFSSMEESADLSGSGVELTGCVLTGESEVRGEEASWQGKGWAQIGERGFPVRGQMERWGKTGDLGVRVSGSEMGWERIGELSGDLTGDWPDGFSGEAMGETGGEEAGEAEGRVMAGAGDGMGAENETDEGLSGFLTAGDTAVFSSSGKKGTGKKRMPGDFTCRSRESYSS